MPSSGQTSLTSPIRPDSAKSRIRKPANQEKTSSALPCR